MKSGSRSRAVITNATAGLNWLTRDRAGCRKGDQGAARHHRCRASHLRRDQEHPGDVRQGTGHGDRIQPQRAGARDRVVAGPGAGRREGLAASSRSTRRCRRSWPIGSRSSGCSSTSSPTRSNPWARRGAGRAASRSARRALDGQDVLLEVSDTGIGIAPEEMAQHLRRLLHDQGDRHRPRPVALPYHRRGAWRAPLGLAGRGVWRDLPPAAAECCPVRAMTISSPQGDRIARFCKA